MSRKLLLIKFRLKTKIKQGNIVLTTHRLIFFKNGQGLDIPLCYVDSLNPTVS
jgi:hypothetical protein